MLLKQNLRRVKKKMRKKCPGRLERFAISSFENIFGLSCFRIKCHCCEREAAIFLPRLSSLLASKHVDVSYEPGAPALSAVADGVDSPYRGSCLFAQSVDSSFSVYWVEIRSFEPQFRKKTRCAQFASDLYGWLENSGLCESINAGIPALWE